jgi:hypothetical protein
MSYGEEDTCMSHTQCDAHKDMLGALDNNSIHAHEVGLFEGLVPKIVEGIVALVVACLVKHLYIYIIYIYIYIYI